MTTSSFSFRQLRRPLVVLFGLLAIAVGVTLATPSQSANAQSLPIGKCLGSPFCTVLHVKLNPAVKYATVVAERVKDTGRDDDLMLQYDYDDGSDNWQDLYTTADVISGTSSGTNPCNVAPLNDTGYFDITVRGPATGSKAKVNMCANGDPKTSGGTFTTDSGQKAQVKTITVNVTTDEQAAKQGGIKGTAQIDVDGKKKNCDSDTVVDITNNSTKKKTSINISGSKFDTGLTLDPGKYTVYLNCLSGSGTAGKHYSHTWNDVTVVAGKTTTLDALSCSSTSSDGACDAPDDSSKDPTEENLCPIKNWAFAWAACPLVTGLMGTDDDDPSAGGVIGQFQDWIVSSTIINTDDIFGKTDGTTSGKTTAYYKAWNSFRVIAISILIIAGIVMVVSQAFGMGIFDAYTIRKLLPRILVIAIIIALSWWIMRYVVQFVDNLTVWVASIIASPFKDIAPEPFSAKALIAQWLGILGAVALVNPVILLSYVGTIVTALAVLAIALAMRKLIIVFIIITMPLWLALMLFEGTEDTGKTMIKTAWKLGLVGIAMNSLITMGSIGAKLTTSDGDPLRLLPLGLMIGAAFGAPILAFQIMAGTGPTGKIFGGLNDRSKGVFDRLRNTRAEQRAGIIDSMKKGERFNNGNVFSRGFNKTTRFATNAPKVGVNPLAMKRRYGALTDQADRRAGNEALEKMQKAGIDQDDYALLAASKSDAGAAIKAVTARARADLNGAVSSGKMTAAEADVQARQLAVAATGSVEAADIKFGTRGAKIAGAMQRVNTGTGIRDQQDLVETIADAAGGNASTAASLAGFANAATKRASRFDLAPGFGALNGLVQQQLKFNQGAGTAVTREQYIQSGVAAAMGATNTDIARTKTTGVTNLANDLNAAIRMQNNILTSTTASADVKRQARERLGEYTQKLSNMQQTTTMYGAEINTLALHDNAAQPLRTVINQVNQRTAPTTQGVDLRPRITVVNPATGQTHEIDNPQYNRPIQVPNVNYDPVMAARQQALAPTRGGRNDFEDQNLRNPGS